MNQKTYVLQKEIKERKSQDVEDLRGKKKRKN